MRMEAKPADRSGSCWGTVAALVAADGSAASASMRALIQPPLVARDVADAVHLICMLHGRHPGIIDYAIMRALPDDPSGWLKAAHRAFTDERAYLARLASAAGPLPSTPGQAESEAAVVAQRHALDMLAQSDRSGCAVGAAVALVMDWPAIRLILDVAAQRFGVDCMSVDLPDAVLTEAFVGTYARTPSVERAVAFGVQQVLAQQRGLWDLLDARKSARDHL